MRALVFYAFAATLVVLALAFNLNAAHHRIAVLEQQLAPASHTVATATTTRGSSRTFTASSGYVLSTADLDRIDNDHTAEKAAAELEYYMKTHPLYPTRRMATKKQ